MAIIKGLGLLFYILLGFRQSILSLGFRVWCLGFAVWASVFRVSKPYIVVPPTTPLRGGEGQHRPLVRIPMTSRSPASLEHVHRMGLPKDH